MDADTIRTASVVLAAREMLPAEPSDLTGILLAPEERSALLSGFPTPTSSELTTYLCNSIDTGRVSKWVESLESMARKSAVSVMLAGESGYPKRLSECWNSPPFLFVEGKYPTGPSVAIVGSRSASRSLVRETRLLAADLASSGLTIVSGLAAGVDTAAHVGALDVDGKTAAIMGTGIEQMFPVENRRLADSIRESGALVSQFAPQTPRTSTTFLARNCVIAGSSDASLIMAGRERSGSRHELDQAISYGRPALMWAPTLWGEDWAKDLADRGLAFFVSSANEVRDYVGESV